MMNINIYKCLQVWSDIYMHQLLEWYVVTLVSNVVCFFINQNWTHHSCSFCNKIVAQQTWRRVLKRVFPQKLFFNLTSPVSCTHSLLQFASYMLERCCYVQGSSKRLFIIIFYTTFTNFNFCHFFTSSWIDCFICLEIKSCPLHIFFFVLQACHIWHADASRYITFWGFVKLEYIPIFC